MGDQGLWPGGRQQDGEADGIPLGVASLNVRPEIPADYKAIGHVSRFVFGHDDEAHQVEAVREAE